MALPRLPGIREVECKRIFDVRARSQEVGDMLVLSRKLGEKICIGENICITIVDIDRGKVRLGIDAPRDIPISRSELLSNPKPAPADTPIITR
jgi:carbon storage regulator